MSVLPEILATLRCARLAAGLPVLWHFSRQEGPAILDAVDREVMPLVREMVPDRDEQEWIRGAFQTAAIKFGIGMWRYARMAGQPADISVIVLATAFTRLYDDLMDHGDDHELDDRFEMLLKGEDPVPSGRLERLMHGLFHAIVSAARPGEMFYRDVADLHGWQRESRRQREDRLITATELRDITWAKGGLGILVLYALGRQSVPGPERDVIEDIGAVGQMLDDQHDLPIDLMDGISTPATTGHWTAYEVGRETRRLAGRLREHFGARKARHFNGLLFLYQAGLITRRLRLTKRYPPVAQTPLRILFGLTRDVTPHWTAVSLSRVSASTPKQIG
jgi:hypothetical protein